jgi:hypothetical protein
MSSLQPHRAPLLLAGGPKEYGKSHTRAGIQGFVGPRNSKLSNSINRPLGIERYLKSMNRQMRNQTHLHLVHYKARVTRTVHS